MYNYTLIIPSILVLFTLLAFFFMRRRLPIRMNRTFVTILVVQLSVVTLDITSSLVDENYHLYPATVIWGINLAYFVAFIFRIYLFYQFTMDVMEVDRTRPLARLSQLPFLLSELICLSSPLTGAIFSVVETGYQRGPLYDVLYGCFGFYLALSFGLLILNRNQLRKNVLVGGLAYNLVLTLGVITRILLPRYLVMDTFCVVAILVIYLAFLNPDLYLSERGAVFNMRGFRLIMAELAQKQRYRMLAFVLQNYNRERTILGGEQMDQVIRQINRYLSHDFPRFMPFYLRGGRFVLVTTGQASLDDARRQIAERFAHPWHIGTGDLGLSVDFAMLNSDANLGSADRIINNLVLALANPRRGDQSENGAIDIQELDRQVDILYSLEQALEHDGVEVFLQPVAESRTGRIVAAEALARIRDKDGKIIPPGLFIPIAERSGYINRLGEQVFEKTCAFIRQYDIASAGLLWINVNLSPIQCMQRSLPERFNRILLQYQVPVTNIHLEITEQSMVDYSNLQQQIQGLQDSGFQFVLDDFGSGYSNLTRVKHYPFINIKIDMEVVWDYFRDHDGLLPTIIDGFHSMGFSITAEGIETEEMARALTEIGSDYLQGYLFSKPLPPAEFMSKYGRAGSPRGQ